MRLVGTEALERIIEVAILSGAFPETPLSLLLVGPSGGGKSRTLLAFAGKSALITNDLTARGLFDIFERDSGTGNIRHIILPDFNSVVSHKSSTTNLILSMLLSAMSEGMVRIDDGRQTKECKHLPIGVISAMTPDMFELYCRRFAQTGLMRRFLPVHFAYSELTRMKAQRAIAEGKIRMAPLDVRRVDVGKAIKLPSISSSAAHEIETLSMRLTSYLDDQYRARQDRRIKISTKIEPFAPHLILRLAARSHALRRRAVEVGEEDYAFACELVEFANREQPKAL